MIMERIIQPVSALPRTERRDLQVSPVGHATGKPRVLLTFNSQYPESTAMLAGIAHYTSQRDPWSVFVDQIGRPDLDAAWLLEDAWDGVISRHTGPELVEACAERGIPLVDLNDSPPFVGVPKIRPDNFEIGRLGASYLIERGFRHFAFCGRGHEGWARERRHGYVARLAERGFDCTVFEPADPPAHTPPVNHQQIQILADWLKSLPKPVAVMACHDARALQLLDAGRVAGVSMPEEAAVLGANNDSAYCDLAAPSLSSVATNPFLSGYRAAETLAALLVGLPPRSFDDRIAPVRVISRRSTDVMAIPDKHVAAALRYISLHACEGITVDEVLPHAAVSRSQLEKKFRTYLGRSPQAEIRRMQVLKIRQLLAETEFPLKRIAELTGFDYPEYMCVVFRRFTGETLGAFRKRTQFAGYLDSMADQRDPEP